MSAQAGLRNLGLIGPEDRARTTDETRRSDQPRRESRSRKRRPDKERRSAPRVMWQETHDHTIVINGDVILLLTAEQ
ncbi:MAG: hypothetical protein QJR02_08250 [Sinobacteraceae bacterium]|nr:hypothetical protein [Nevskiaceae bacterium]